MRASACANPSNGPRRYKQKPPATLPTVSVVFSFAYPLMGNAHYKRFSWPTGTLAGNARRSQRTYASRPRDISSW